MEHQKNDRGRETMSLEDEFNTWYNADDDEGLKENQFFRIEQEFFKDALLKNREACISECIGEGGVKRLFYVHLYNTGCGIGKKELCSDVGLNRTYFYDGIKKLENDVTQSDFLDFAYRFKDEGNSLSHVENVYKEMLVQTKE